MGKLRDVLLGTRAIKRVPMPLVNVPSEYSVEVPELAQQRDSTPAGAEATTPPGTLPGAFVVPEIGIRAMTGLEQSMVFEHARRYSTKRGGNPDNPADALYNFAIAVYTVAIGCIDPDSNPSDPEPFFGNKGDPESGLNEILSSAHIGRDGIVFLQEQQEMWQDLVSPQALQVAPEKLWGLASEVATSGDAGPFLRLRPGMRWKLLQFLASHWLNSQTTSSPSSSDSASSPSTQTSS
jgi:hypothetical protein